MSGCGSFAQLRALHNVAFPAPAPGQVASGTVNIFLNKQLVIRNLSYTDLTDYLPVEAGRYRLRVLLTDGTLLIDGYIHLKAGHSYTAMVSGLVSIGLTATLYKDQVRCPQPGTSRVRFIHGLALAGSQPGTYAEAAVDVLVGDSVIFCNVKYLQDVVLEDAPLGTLPISVRLHQDCETSGGTFLLQDVPVSTISGGNYTIFASGNPSASPPIDVSAIVGIYNPGECEQLQCNFEVNEYMGKWWQIASIPQPFGSNCYRQTAEYTLLVGEVKVVNNCLSAAGEPSEIIVGQAVPGCNPASLTVSFPPIPEPTGPNYLVHETDYCSYAIVGSPDRTTLFFLARESIISAQLYCYLVKQAKALGYDTSALVVDQGAVDYCQRKR